MDLVNCTIRLEIYFLKFFFKMDIAQEEAKSTTGKAM